MEPNKLEHLVTESFHFRDVRVRALNYVRTRCLQGLVGSVLRTRQTSVGSITAPSQTEIRTPRVRNGGWGKARDGSAAHAFAGDTTALLANEFGRDPNDYALWRRAMSCQSMPPAHKYTERRPVRQLDAFEVPSPKGVHPLASQCMLILINASTMPANHRSRESRQSVGKTAC